MKKTLKYISFLLLPGTFATQALAQTADTAMKVADTTTKVAVTPSTVDTDSAAIATPPQGLPTDGYYGEDMLEGAKPFPYPSVAKENVRFFKRVYRDIDLSDSRNKIFMSPNNTLMDVIIEAIKNGKMIAYDPTSTKDNPTGDAFITPLTPTQAIGRLTDSVLVPQFDSNGTQTGATMKLNDFNPETVGKFRIKEDIFYDRQRSQIETRIIGLAPLIKIKAADELVSEQPAFWLYFPQCRFVLVTKQVTDEQRQIYNESLDDIFIQHSFNSQIVKEANPADLSIKDYAQDKQQMDEADKIQQQIDAYKKKTWKY